MMKRLMNISFALCVICALCFSCSKSTQPAAKKGPLPQKSVQGSVLNLSLDTTVDSLDSGITVYATSFEVIGDCIDGLKQMGDDGSIKNAICEEQTVSDDGLFYTFKLRKDAYWSNGDPVTAHDFVFAWQRAVAPETNSEYAFLISEIAQIKNGLAVQTGLMEKDQLGVRAVDDYTLQVELEVPVTYFDQLLYFSTFYPINQKFMEKVGENYGTSPETFLSNGAFLLTSYYPETKSIDLMKNTAYYDAANIKLAGLHYEVVEDTALGLEQYKAGKLDLVELSAEQIPEWKNSPEFKPVDTGFMYYISFNLHNEYLANKNFRKALTLAFDRTVVCDLLANGSKPAWTAVPAGYTFDAAGVDFSKTGIEFPDFCSYNPAKAREYMEIAKKELGKSRFTIEFITAGVEEQEQCCKIIMNEIQKVLPEVSFTLRSVPRKDRRSIMAKGDYEIGLTNWGPDYPDPMTYLAMWMTGNDNNTGDYRNPAYDAILAQCTSGDLCTKTELRWAALKEAETMLMDDAVIMPVFSQCNINLIKPNVNGIAFHAIGINRIYKRATK